MDHHSKIRDILLREWDPIGIKDIPEAQDEYDSYIKIIHKMLIDKKPHYDIFQYLWWLETEHMGLLGDLNTTEKVARQLSEVGGKF